MTYNEKDEILELSDPNYGNQVLPDELCFHVETSRDNKNCSSVNCTTPGSMINVQRESDVLMVISFGRGLCSDPTYPISKYK